MVLADLLFGRGTHNQGRNGFENVFFIKATHFLPITHTDTQRETHSQTVSHTHTQMSFELSPSSSQSPV